MLITLVSDIHTEFPKCAYYPSEEQRKADVVVLAGDIGIGSAGAVRLLNMLGAWQQVVMVAGNHEYYGRTLDETEEELLQVELEYPNFHYLQNGESFVHEDVAFIGATLWTDFYYGGYGPMAIRHALNNMADYRKIKKYADPYVKRAITPYDTMNLHEQHLISILDEVERLSSNVQQIAVCTHHCPTTKAIPDRYKFDPLTAAFCSPLEKIITAHTEITYWFYGHCHYSSFYNVGNTFLASNPYGYPGEDTNYKPGFIIDTEDY